ncbi:MAG: UDP-2,3-diacylglucosamine diphosphatase LpxI [Beijerinckiaceae bacterium]|nr:UDP-2,3-diacylglucosamine diphosphatase LpxI [Beijerinckiaceae bacterium]
MSAAPSRPPMPGPVAIIAGSGTLPLHVAASARRAGHAVFVALLAGSADAADYDGFDHQTFGLGQFGALSKALTSRGILKAAFIGAVVRPGITDIRPDMGLIRHWQTITAAFRKGDDGLLSAVVDILEAHGVRVVSALDLAPDLAIGQPGPIGLREPDAVARGEIDLGLDLIAALSPFDVGQCVVVSDGRPVAIEGAEGTDAMLERVAEMRRNGRLKRETGGGVLIKAPKRGQNMRIDIPTIGPQTVRRATEAGLQGIAITVGEVIVADREETIALADANGLFIEARR